jgi:hypothetical protein
MANCVPIGANVAIGAGWARPPSHAARSNGNIIWVLSEPDGGASPSHLFPPKSLKRNGAAGED